MGPIEEQVEAELACACQRMYALFRRRVAAEFADDLSALTVDIEHWQQKNTVVVCGDFNARIGRQGAESPTNSVVLSSERSRTLKELR
jgi:uncharacterized protein CbrC (UPF0167 family)